MTETETPKKTRGPARDTVRFADLVERISTYPHPSARIPDALRAGVTSADIGAAADVREASLALYIAVERGMIAEARARAKLVAKIEKLPDALRAALLATFPPAPPAPPQ